MHHPYFFSCFYTSSLLVKRIVRWGPPAGIESYIQETGRAGRDGEQSLAQLYYMHPLTFIRGTQTTVLGSSTSGTHIVQACMFVIG